MKSCSLHTFLALAGSRLRSLNHFANDADQNAVITFCFEWLNSCNADAKANALILEMPRETGFVVFTQSTGIQTVHDR